MEQIRYPDPYEVLDTSPYITKKNFGKSTLLIKVAFPEYFIHIQQIRYIQLHLKLLGYQVENNIILYRVNN